MGKRRKGKGECGKSEGFIEYGKKEEWRCKKI
jgi:hypothetical protein